MWVSLKVVLYAWLAFYVDVANVPELNLCFWLVTLVNVVYGLKFSNVRQRHLQSGYESAYCSGILFKC